MRKFIKHRAWIWFLVFVRQNSILVFRFHPEYSYLGSSDKGGEDCFNPGIPGYRQELHVPLRVYPSGGKSANGLWLTNTSCAEYISHPGRRLLLQNDTGH